MVRRNKYYHFEANILGKSIIAFPDYKRIFSTIYSTLQSENAEINHSCIYFSVIGSLILHKYYRINAKVYMGIAAYMLNEIDMNVLAFAEKNDNHLTCTENGFHSWIVANEWVIDFTAPLFPNMLKTMYKNASCKPKMFQKPLSHMRASAAELGSKGDFFLCENINFANEMMDLFVKRPFNTDIAEICCQWYRRPPTKMMKSITVGDGAGKVKQVQLKSYKISGSW
jgi:hypothetical protein